MNTLIEFCNSITPIKLSVTKDETLLKWKALLFQTTKFLDFYDNPPLALRYYCILNNITEIPLCICGNKVLYKKHDPKLGFAQFCSPTCSRSNKDSNKDYQKYIQDYDWLYNQRITLQKSKEQIAKELGCSVAPINKWLEKHNIEQKKVGIRNIKIPPPPKEELENLYFNDMLTLVDIGIKYDVSNVTVKKWFKEYNISLLPHSETIRLKVQEKIQKTNIERYGVNQVFSLPHVQEKIRNTFIDKYGVPYHPIDNTSNAEIEVLNFFNSIITGFKKERIFGIELDGYNKSICAAFEYCGIFWHQENIKGKYLHAKKYNICKENNIRLITIFEDEWLCKQDLVKTKIKHILGKNDNKKVYARKCIIENVPIHKKQQFLNLYHIQGDDNGSINLGLYYENELVAIMSFMKQNDKKYELNRYATKYNVIGGFGKILNYFKSNYEWDNIITFADLRWHTGDVYIKHNFTVDKILKPDYEYVYNKQRLHKFNFRHKAIEKKFPDLYDPNLSETENMDKIGIPRIWGCGKIRFILKNDLYNI